MSKRLQTTSDNVQIHQRHCTALHFDENGAKWKDSSKADDDRRLHEPERSQDSTYQYDNVPLSVYVRPQSWSKCLLQDDKT